MQKHNTILIIGLLVANLLILLYPNADSYASTDLQSTGKIVINNPETGQLEVIFDYKDQEKLKSDIIANSLEINDLRDYVDLKDEEYTIAHEVLADKDTELENVITGVTDSMGGLEFSYDADGKGQYRVSGASEWIHF